MKVNYFQVFTVVSLLLGSSLWFPSATRADQPSIATVQSVNENARFCSLDVIDINGLRSTEIAAPSLCRQPALRGQQVQLTYGAGTVPDMSCGADINCSEVDNVLMVTQAVPWVSARQIQSFPDGNYRYWSNSGLNDNTISEEALLTNGGITVSFRKKGNNITGVFSYVGGESICIAGQVRGNTVSGIAAQTLTSVSVLSTGATFANFGPSLALKVRQGRHIDGTETARYNSMLLNLNGFNRINAGTTVPPKRC